MKKITLLFLLSSLLCNTLFAQQSDTLHSTPIQEIVVTGKRIAYDSRISPTTISVIQQKDIERSNRHSLLPTLAEQVPGLFITSRSNMGFGVSTGAAGGITMRGVGGSPTTGVMILVDGQPQYMSLMGHPIADTALSSLAERVEVVRGPASTHYGSNAMGGVINIITRKAPINGSQTKINVGYGSFNTLRSSLATLIHKSKVHTAITGNYDRTDSHRSNMGFVQYGGSAKLGVDIGREWDITTNINITHFDASNPGSISAPIIDNDSHITRLAATASLGHNKEWGSGAINFIYNYGHHHINDGHAEGEPAPDYRFISDDSSFGVSLYQTLRWNAATLTAGIDFRRYGGRALNRYIADNSTSLIADKELYNLGSYFTMHYQPFKLITIDAGIRFDYNTPKKREWVPRVGVTLHTSNSSQLKAIVSKGFRFPTIREMYMFPSQNPNLQSERLMNYELSFNQSFSMMRYGVNIFYIDGENMIQTAMIDGRPKNINTGRIENFGIEAELSIRPIRSIELMANYSYLNMRYRILASPEHKLFASATYSSRRWSVTTSIQHISGLTTQVNPPQEQSYTLWNISSEFQLSRRIRLFAQAENLLNQKYEINAGYPMPGTTINGGIKLIL